MALPQSHEDLIVINITLAAAIPQTAGFGNVLYMVDEALGNDLGGARVVTYANATEAGTAQAAGDITAAVLTDIQAFFSQTPQSAKIKVGRVDTGVGETYADALLLIEVVDSDFYGIAMDDKTDAEILLVAASVESAAIKRLYMLQSNDADWITSGLPPLLATLSTRERSAIVYHDDDAEANALAYLAARLVFNPDTLSAAWNAPVAGIAALAALTQAEKDFARGNNANIGLPLLPSPFWMDKGVTATGRPIDHRVTADWFEARLQALVQTEMVNFAARGEKLSVTPFGQAVMLGVLETQFALGVAAGHFVAGQTEATPVPITAGDISARKLRFTGRAQLTSSLRIVEFSLNFELTPITA